MINVENKIPSDVKGAENFPPELFENLQNSSPVLRKMFTQN